jgi:general nucleoside transport system permease protein
MNVLSGIIIAMALSGALAGLAGANEVLGVNYNLALAFSSGYGFDSIALALLGKSHPLGVVLAAATYLAPCAMEPSACSYRLASPSISFPCYRP